MKDKFLLFGMLEEISNETEEGLEFRTQSDLLAIFDSMQLVKKYIEDSKTDQYREYSNWRSTSFQFKRKSLLYGYQWAEVKTIKNNLPHNPIL